MRACYLVGSFLIIMVLSAGCPESQSPFGSSAAPAANPKQDAWDAQYQDQLDRSTAQLDELDRQAKRQDSLIDRWEKQQMREEALMAKREEQAKRINALIEHWEQITAAVEGQIKAKGE